MDLKAFLVVVALGSDTRWVLPGDILSVATSLQANDISSVEELAKALSAPAPPQALLSLFTPAVIDKLKQLAC
jgi:hypothetical protein